MKRTKRLHLIAGTGLARSSNRQTIGGVDGTSDGPAEREEDLTNARVRQRVLLGFFEELADSYAQCAAWTPSKKQR